MWEEQRQRITQERGAAAWEEWVLAREPDDVPPQSDQGLHDLLD